MFSIPCSELILIFVIPPNLPFSTSIEYESDPIPMISSVSIPDPRSDSNDVSDVTYRPYLQQNVIISWLYIDFKGLNRDSSLGNHVTVPCLGFQVWNYNLKPISDDNISKSNFFANNQSMTHFYVLTCNDLR